MAAKAASSKSKPEFMESKDEMLIESDEDKFSDRKIDFNYDEFSEKVKILLTNKILTTNLDDLLKDKKLIKLLNNKKMLSELYQGYLETDPPALASGGMGSVYLFGNNILKKTILCADSFHPNIHTICRIAQENDVQYETVDTDKNSDILYKNFGVPNYILEILSGIYISNKISPYTDGFCKVYGGLYDKTKSIAYCLQEKLVEYPINMSSMSGTAYMKYLFEILATLSIAQDKYCYVHYDLHHNNIMFRETEKDITRMYNGIFNFPNSTSEKLNISIKSKYQPVIIDYGFSRFSAENLVLYPTESFRLTGKGGLDQNTRYYLDHHLFNSYYDMIMILRSFQESAKGMANDMYKISTYILCYIFEKDPNEIEKMFLTRKEHNVPPNRIRMDLFNTSKKNNIKNVIDYMLACILLNSVFFYNGDARFPPIIIDCMNISESSPDKITQFIVVDKDKKGVSKTPDRYFKNHFINNSASYNFPITVKIPEAPIYPQYVSNQIGNISTGSAWQFCTYTLSRSGLGFINNVVDPRSKWYNLNPRVNYEDTINVACSVMWQPHLTDTPFKFKSDCCRIDPRRYLQNKKEGIVINGSFFNLNRDYGPIGLFKNNQLIIDNTPISIYYIDDFKYIVIDKNGSLNICSYEDINNLNLDIDENSTIFTSGPLLVDKGIQTFTEKKLSECYFNKSGNNITYFKYLSASNEINLISQIGKSVYENITAPFSVGNFPYTISQKDIKGYPNKGHELLSTSEIYIRSSSDIKPGELTHAANANPRSVLALTNNGFVLFFVFPGRKDGFGKISEDPTVAKTQSTGLDLIDLSSLLVKQELLTPLNLPAGTKIEVAINLDGGGSSSLNVKESDKDYVMTSSRNVSSYPVGNVLSYVIG
jgi:hypothetical protein